MVELVTPRDRLHWTQPDYEVALVGAMVQIDTPADPVDQSNGLSLLTDTGVVTAVTPGLDRRWRVRLDDGFVVLVDIDSWMRVCRNPGHGHRAGECPMLPTAPPSSQ